VPTPRDPALSITVDGVAYRFAFSDLTNEIELELFRQSGLTIPQIFAAIEAGSFAPFMVAALVFLARRVEGDRITYAEVSSAITYSSEMDLAEIPVDDVTGDAPEALAAD
jgi:hypothetical protein